MRIHSSRVLQCGPCLALALFIFTAIHPLQIKGQTGTRPQFEASSIKADTLGGVNRNEFAESPGRLNIVNNRLRMIIMQAYGLKQDFLLVGGPSWINPTRYTIQAKAEGNPSEQEMMLMLQTLLEDRFKLRIHRETRELPVYALTAAKGGPKLLQSKEGSCTMPEPNARAAFPAGQPTHPYCGSTLLLMGRWDASRVDMSKIIWSLSTLVDRQIIDKTGLTGQYDIHIEIPPDPLATNDPTSPSLFTVLQDQLGLKLESDKGPVEVLVIDQVEKPTEN
jgi:uncharacterized protein (TIGR03435 family)